MNNPIHSELYFYMFSLIDFVDNILLLWKTLFNQ